MSSVVGSGPVELPCIHGRILEDMVDRESVLVLADDIRVPRVGYTLFVSVHVCGIWMGNFATVPLWIHRAARDESVGNGAGIPVLCPGRMDGPEKRCVYVGLSEDGGWGRVPSDGTVGRKKKTVKNGRGLGVGFSTTGTLPFSFTRITCAYAFVLMRHGLLNACYGARSRA